MNKILDFIKSKKDSHQLIKIVLLFIIGMLISLIPTPITILIGLFTVIMSIIMLYFRIIKIIENKKNKIKIICFSIIATTFLAILIGSLSKDIPFLAKRLGETAGIDQYIITTISKIEDNKAILKGTFNNVPTEFIMEDVGENYKINDEIHVYIDSENPEKYIFMAPTFLNMAHIGLFFLINGALFGAAFVPIKRIYRIFKPKEIKDKEPKVKVKT